jgi:dipeptidyl aminopeptidase/acylaminoacyl peptidase
MKRLSLVALIALAGGSPNPGAASELPVETFFKNFQYRGATLSPDGKRLGVLCPVKDRIGLAIVDLKDNVANWAFSDSTADVMSYVWASADRLILGLGKDGYAVPGMVAVDRTGERSITLVTVGLFGRGTSLLDGRANSSNEVLVASVEHARHPADALLLYPNVERMNINTGTMVMDTKNPGHVLKWITDHNGVVRIGVEPYNNRVRIFHRRSAKAPWETLADYDWNEPGIWPEAFEYDNRTLLVAWIGDGNTEALYTYDVETKRVKGLAFRHAEADIGDVCFSDKQRAVVGAFCQTERPETYWFNPQYKKFQTRVDQALTNTFNMLVNVSDDETKALFLATSDRSPGTYYLLETTAMKLNKLFDVADWIKAEEMAEMKPIEYTARDGLKIHGYLTVPNGSAGKPVPLIVLPHGGPAWRDTWGYNPDVQFLANRGYAVLQVNFRGSTGYGRKFLEAGHKQWGLKQQDDITDGVNWAIAQGIADAKRVAIYGASYGGFAALTGLEQTPELYRCGISYAGVTDILAFIANEPNRMLLKAFSAQSIGDPRKDKAQLRATSPMNNIDKIQVPVFFAYGQLDPKVPIAEARKMADALKKRGKLYDFMVKADEGHGFHKESNRIEFARRVDEFLKEYLQ